MRVLLFGTTYVDTDEKLALVRQWHDMHTKLNGECDLLLVDSASPKLMDFDATFAMLNNVDLHMFSDNIGHLARGGRDGWGRAFCFGIDHAIRYGYDYVAHIEGDSLCRRNIYYECSRMMLRGTVVRSTPVFGTRKVERDWIETGAMLMDVRYLSETDFVGHYDWHDGKRKKYPNTPERVIRNILADKIEMLPWRTMRDDVGFLTPENVINFDWISHTTPAVYDAFVASSLAARMQRLPIDEGDDA